MTVTGKTRREEILEKAALLFHKKGYAATSIRDIAREMNMESASLYNHIRSKQEILQVLLMSLAEKYVMGIDDIAGSPLTSIQKLERIITDHIRITIDNTDVVSLIPNEWVHLDEGYLERFTALRDTYENQFLTIMRKAVKDGYIRKVNVHIAAFSILSTLRWLHSWYSRNKNINPVELEQELLSDLIDGVRRL